MNLQQLLNKASQSNDHAIRCQGRNVELDFAELPSAHPDAATCGDQLPQGSLQHVRNTFPYLTEFDESDDLLNRNFGNLAQDLSSSIKDGQLAFPSISQHTAPIKLVRYMDLDAIHRYWLGGNKTDSAAVKKQRLQTLQSQLNRIKNKQDVWQADTAKLASVLFSKPNAAVWAIPGDGTPPHHQSKYQASAQKANALCRDLALPIEQDQFSEKVGLVAILYQLPQNQLIKPNIAYAEGYAVFFPGLKNEQHGRTAPLSDQFAIPWHRNDNGYGIAEYVHQNQNLLSLAIESIEYVGDFA